MRKDENIDFLDCHSCQFEMDVSKQVIIFNKNKLGQNIIKKTCEKCGSMNQLVISMVYGLTSIEKINKFRNHKTKS